MTNEAFKKAFADQLKKGNKKLFYGHRFMRGDVRHATEIMAVMRDDLDAVAETMKNAVEDEERLGVLPWFTTNE